MVIIIQCEDRVGLVADIATVLAKAGCNWCHTAFYILYSFK